MAAPSSPPYGFHVGRKLLETGTQIVDNLENSLRKKIDKMKDKATELKMLTETRSFVERAIRDNITDFSQDSMFKQYIDNLYDRGLFSKNEEIVPQENRIYIFPTKPNPHNPKAPTFNDLLNAKDELSLKEQDALREQQKISIELPPAFKLIEQIIEILREAIKISKEEIETILRHMGN